MGRLAGEDFEVRVPTPGDRLSPQAGPGRGAGARPPAGRADRRTGAAGKEAAATTPGFAILLIALAAALWAGGLGAADPLPHYNDYVFASSYHPPAPPPPVPLDCRFMGGPEPLCAKAADLDAASREQLVLALARRNDSAEGQELVRAWNANLPLARHYEETPMAPAAGGLDGAWAENGSLRNTWMRLIHLYPSVYDPRDNSYYLGDTTYIQAPSHVEFVVPDGGAVEWCGRRIRIGGYEHALSKSLGGYSTTGQLLPTRTLLDPMQVENLTLTLEARGAYTLELMGWQDQPGGGATCALNRSEEVVDTLRLQAHYRVKRYPDIYKYVHDVGVPQSGFLEGAVHLELPSDFLYYSLTVKGQSLKVQRNDLKAERRGEAYPVLGQQLVAAPGRSGSLHLTALNETDVGGAYQADIMYRVLTDSPDLGESDCALTVATPFYVKTVEGGCRSGRTLGRLKLQVVELADDRAVVKAVVVDGQGQGVEGAVVAFEYLGNTTRATTDSAGLTSIVVERRGSPQTLTARLEGTAALAPTRTETFIPPAAGRGGWGGPLIAFVERSTPTLLILVFIGSLMFTLWRRRTQGGLFLIMLALGVLLPSLHAEVVTTSNMTLDLQSTLEACRTYDFDNAVRHFGECAEAYRLTTEFASLRRTANVLVANIAPLVVANPDITPYKAAYANMVLIALALLRVAWAFNSLYLIMNVFNPVKRSNALKQYIWLIVFVLFAYASYTLVHDTLGSINAVSRFVVGESAAQTLTNTTLSVDFVAENYEMLKLILPFLNITYLILLARYITLIGMVLFFPFSLLLYFTTATRGYGQAALTVTFASLGLGVLNAILLLIYSILLQTADPALVGSLASTFFSASFIIFFGFVNLMVLFVSIMAGVVFIGQNKIEI